MLFYAPQFFFLCLIDIFDAFALIMCNALFALTQD